MLLIQIAADTIACLLIGLLASRTLGARAGRFAAFLYALMPQAIFLSAGVIMVEPLAVLATTAALLALTALVPPPPTRRLLLERSAGLGLALGAGILAKELVLSVAFVIVATLLGSPWRARASAAVVALIVTAAIVSPWLVHNLGVHRTPIVSGTYAHYSLVVDNAPPGRDGLELWRDADGMAAKTELAWTTFADALWQYPRLTFERAIGRLRMATGPDVMLPTWIALAFDGFTAPDTSNLALFRHAWRLPDGTWGRRFQLVCGLATLIVFSLAAAGLALASPGPLRRAALLATALLVISMMLTVAAGRYRLALLPFLAPFAGLALAHATGRARAPGARRRHASRADLGARHGCGAGDDAADARRAVAALLTRQPSAASRRAMSQIFAYFRNT